MKQYTTLAVILSAILPLVSCQKEPSSERTPEEQTRTLSFSVHSMPNVAPAGAEAQCPEVRATLSGTSVVWQPGDQIGIVPKGQTTIYPFTTTTGGSSATFTGTVTGDAEDDTYYAFYPYEADSLGTYTGKVTGEVWGGSVSNQSLTSFRTPLSHVQHAVEGNIDPYFNFCFAESNTGSFAMKNLLSLLKFQVSDGNVNKVVFRANAPAGYLTGGRFITRFVKHSDGEPFEQCLGSTGRRQCVVVLPPEGEATFSTGKTYYAAVAPKMGAYSSATQPSFNYTIYAILYKTGYYSQKASSSAIALARNTIYDCGTLDPAGTGWTGWKSLTTNNVTVSFASKTYNKKTSGSTVTQTADFPTTSNTSSITAKYKIGGSAWANVTLQQDGSAFLWDETNTSLFCNCNGGTRTGILIEPLVYKPISRLVFTFVKVAGDSDTPEVRVCEGIGSSSQAYGSGTCDLSDVAVGETKNLTLNLDPYSIGCWFTSNIIGKAHIRNIALRYN